MSWRSISSFMMVAFASNWAVEAKVGDQLTIGGPRVRWWCRKITHGSCTCDESGMPALPPPFKKHRKTACSPGDPRHRHRGRCDVPGRSGAPERVQHHPVIGHNEQAVADHLAALAVPEEDYFIWLTGEGRVKRLSRQFETDAIGPTAGACQRVLARQIIRQRDPAALRSPDVRARRIPLSALSPAGQK